MAVRVPGDATSEPLTASGLQSLEITDFRNIENARLGFSPGLNLITGANAAGKTSLLEAIFCLGRVHSFRSSDADCLIRDNQPAWRLVGCIGLAEGRGIPVGIERYPGRYRIHLEGRPVSRLSDLAGRLPVHIMSGDTANILDGGPRYRRQTLDWALFHVEHGYREAWQRYVRALRQRNAALRAQAPVKQISAWDAELIDAAGILDRLRRGYLDELAPHLHAEFGVLLPGIQIALRYRSGWAQDMTLATALDNSLDRDRAQGYTHAGPHRGDFSLRVEEKPIMTCFSRGQQKATVLAFLLAQQKLQHARAAPQGAFLLDDLASEMDADHQTRVIAALAELQAQVFVTAIDPQALACDHWPVNKRFHVEHGAIHEVV
ncbi:MAG: DNA replication/repair protein RecF [Gammaproteobacteria bacterium]|nr:MAG: DNA replication/repair protein RecF [Gammaproteobacteria bacterium]